MDSFTPLRFRDFKTKPVLSDPQLSLASRSFNGKAPIIVSTAGPGYHDDKLYHGGSFSSIDRASNDSGILIGRQVPLKPFHEVGSLPATGRKGHN